MPGWGPCSQLSSSPRRMCCARSASPAPRCYVIRAPQIYDKHPNARKELFAVLVVMHLRVPEDILHWAARPPVAESLAAASYADSNHSSTPCLSSDMLSPPGHDLEVQGFRVPKVSFWQELEIAGTESASN